MIVWVGRPLILTIHDRQLAEHGGRTGVRDAKLLESTLARPQQLHADGKPRPDLADLAASLMIGLARNHPFVDGNSRTAAVVCETFLALNGAILDADDLEFYPVCIGVAEGALEDAEFQAWLRQHIQFAVSEKRGTRSMAGFPR